MTATTTIDPSIQARLRVALCRQPGHTAAEVRFFGVLHEWLCVLGPGDVAAFERALAMGAPSPAGIA